MNSKPDVGTGWFDNLYHFALFNHSKNFDLRVFNFVVGYSCCSHSCPKAVLFVQTPNSDTSFFELDDHELTS